jgi:hypothetical protein
MRAKENEKKGNERRVCEWIEKNERRSRSNFIGKRIGKILLDEGREKKRNKRRVGDSVVENKIFPR